MAMRLDLEKLNIFYGDFHAVQDVNLSVAPRSVTAFIGNMFGLQTILVPSFGGNFPLWSLANETWYYILFPLLVLVLRGRSIAWRRI